MCGADSMDPARIPALAQRLASDAQEPRLRPTDMRLLQDILRDEVRWGSRGELTDFKSTGVDAIFDARGDAAKFRRLVIRAGFVVSEVVEKNVTSYAGMDYIVTVLGI